MTRAGNCSVRFSITVMMKHCLSHVLDEHIFIVLDDLDRVKQAYIIDFGSALLMKNPPAEWPPGTDQFMAPERDEEAKERYMKSPSSLGENLAKVDVWGTVCIFVFMLLLTQMDEDKWITWSFDKASINCFICEKCVGTSV